METLACMFLSLEEKNIIVPAAAIAEVMIDASAQNIPDSPNWLLGILTWRGIRIPLVCLEKMASHLEWNQSDKSREQAKGAYVAIINRIYPRKEGSDMASGNQYPFFSIILNGTPRFMRVKEDEIKMISDFKENNCNFLSEIKTHDIQALIPDLNRLWNIIDAMPPRLQWFRQVVL